MPLLATKILSDYISQMQKMHQEVVESWREIKVRCNIPISLQRKVQSFDVLLTLVGIQGGLLHDEVPDLKKEMKRQLSMRDRRIKELVAKLDHLSPSTLLHVEGRPPYADGKRRYPKSTTPAQRRSQKRPNRAPIPRMSADNVRGGPISYSPFYCSRTPYISASPSTASKHASPAKSSPFSPKKEWFPKQAVEPVEDGIIHEIGIFANDMIPSNVVSPKKDLRKDLTRKQREDSNQELVNEFQRERRDLKELSISPRSVKSSGSFPTSPLNFKRSPKLKFPKANKRQVLELPAMPICHEAGGFVVENQKPLTLPNSGSSPAAKSRAKKDPAKASPLLQDDLIRKEFESLGIDYTSEDVLKVNEANSKHEDLIRKEFESLGIDYTSDDVLKVNEANSKKSDA